MFGSLKIALVILAAAAGLAVLAGGLGDAAGVGTVARAASVQLARPPLRLGGHRMHPRPGAVRPGTRVSSASLFGDRAFANARDGFALGNDGAAQYPARSRDGGRSWKIDGPQLHIDAADGPEGVGYVGIVDPRTFFAYGSSVVDVTTNGGRTWWETYLGELVMAVVPGPDRELVAYVQQSVTNGSRNAVTWQYVSSDGGRHWSYSTALGGLS